MRNNTTLLPLGHICICQFPTLEARRGGRHCPVRSQMNLINERHVAKTEMNRAREVVGAKHTFVTGRVRALATCMQLIFGTFLFCVESYHCIVCNEEFTRSYNFTRHCDSANTNTFFSPAQCTTSAGIPYYMIPIAGIIAQCLGNTSVSSTWFDILYTYRWMLYVTGCLYCT